MLPTKYCPVSIHTEYIKCNAQKAGLCKIDNTYYPLYHYHSHFISPKLLTIKVSNKFSLSIYIYIVYHSYTYLSIYLYIYISMFLLSPPFWGFTNLYVPINVPSRENTGRDLQATPVTEPSRKRLCNARASWMGSTSWRRRVCGGFAAEIWGMFDEWVWCEFDVNLRGFEMIWVRSTCILYIKISLYMYMYIMYIYIYMYNEISNEILWLREHTRKLHHQSKVGKTTAPQTDLFCIALVAQYIHSHV